MGGRARGLLAATVALGLLCVPSGASADVDLGEVGGYFYRADSTTASGLVDVSVDCLAGSRVLGGGWSGGFAKREEVVDGPDANTKPGDRWRVMVEAGASPQLVEAFAVCSTLRVRYVSVRERIPAGRAGVARASCPAGTAAVAGGGRVIGPTDPTARVLATQSFDGPDANPIAADGWRVRANSPSEDARVRAQAICKFDDFIRGHYAGGQLPTAANGTTTRIYGCPLSFHLVSFGSSYEGPPNNGGPTESSFNDSGDSEPDTVPDDIGQTLIFNDSGVEETYRYMGICLE
jgi:hypothetical protein